MIYKNDDQIKWVQVLWNFEAEQGSPYPDDSSLIKKECPYGGIAEFIGQDSRFLKLRFGDHIVRVNPFSIVTLPKTPLFSRNEIVKADTTKGHSEFKSTIEGMAWHFKESLYYYTLKGKSKHYWEEDLIKIKT